jgi:hypothetical protein
LQGISPLAQVLTIYYISLTEVVYIHTRRTAPCVHTMLPLHPQSEEVRYGRNYSDDEEEGDVSYARPSPLMATQLAQRNTKSEPSRKFSGLFKKKKKAISRRKEVGDDLATYFYQMRSSKSSDYSHFDEPPNDNSSDEES